MIFIAPVLLADICLTVLPSCGGRAALVVKRSSVAKSWYASSHRFRTVVEIKSLFVAPPANKVEL